MYICICLERPGIRDATKETVEVFFIPAQGNSVQCPVHTDGTTPTMTVCYTGKYVTGCIFVIIDTYRLGFGVASGLK